jgi:hypothetical protein
MADEAKILQGQYHSYPKFLLITGKQSASRWYYYRFNWRGHRTASFGTWNIKSLMGKETDMINEMKKMEKF